MSIERSTIIYGSGDHSKEIQKNPPKEIQSTCPQQTKKIPAQNSHKPTDKLQSEQDSKIPMFRLSAQVHVHEITDIKQCETLLASAVEAVALGEQDVLLVGLDTEWGEGSKVTLLQIAFEKYCFLVQSAHEHTSSLPPFVRFSVLYSDTRIG